MQTLEGRPVRTWGEHSHLEAKERGLRRNQTSQQRDPRLPASRAVGRCVSIV